MIGYILAAGFGVRMKPLTDHIPKALLPVCGMPLLQRNIDYLLSQGIGRIGVNTHYMPEQLHAFKERSAVDFTLFHEKERIRGTAGPLYDARDFLAGSPVFCVQNVDILSNAPLQKLKAMLEASGDIGYILCTPSRGRGSVFYDMTTNAYRGVPADTVYTVGLGKADFTGVSLYKKEVLSFFSPEDFSVLPVWKRIREATDSLKVIILEDLRWMDIGTPAAYAHIHFLVLDRRCTLPIPESTDIVYERKIAVPKGRYEVGRIQWGCNVWADSDLIPEDACVDNSVILSGATVISGTAVSNKIVTPWETISIGQ